MIFDINAYFGKWPYWKVNATTGASLLALLERHKIDMAAIASTRAIFVDCERGNEEVARLVADNPQKLMGFAVVSPTYGKEALAQLRRAAEVGIKGLRLFPFYHGYRFDDDPTLQEIITEAAELSMPVMIPLRIIMNWGLPALEIQEVAQLIIRFPRTHFILGCVNRELRAVLGLMRDHENVSIETSCLQIPYSVERLVDQVGPERVLYGSGLPLQYPACGLARIESAEITDEEKALVFGENARRLLNL